MFKSLLTAMFYIVVTGSFFFLAHVLTVTLLQLIPNSITSLGTYFVWSILRVTLMALIVAVLLDGVCGLKPVPVAMIVALVYCLDFIVIFSLYELGIDTFLSNTIYSAWFWGVIVGFCLYWFRGSLAEDKD